MRDGCCGQLMILSCSTEVFEAKARFPEHYETGFFSPLIGQDRSLSLNFKVNIIL